MGGTRRSGWRAPRLLLRYLAAGALVVAASVGGTVWLSQTAEYRYDVQDAAFEREQDERIIDALTRWAGAHPDWEGVGPELLRLEHETGRRIALVGGDGAVVADTAPELPRPQASTLLLDPLEPSADLVTGELGLHDGIVGPFRLDDAERARSAALAGAVRDCLGDALLGTAVWESGRAVVAGYDDAPDCGRTGSNQPFPGERAALDDLRDRTNGCLLAAGLPVIERVELDLQASVVAERLAVRAEPAGDAAVDECLLQARIDQAAPSTAPAVDIVLTDLRGDARGPLDASPGSVFRFGAVVAVLLVLLVAAAALITAPTRRNARRLAAAADRFSAGERGGLSGLRDGDDLAEVGAAFDRMSQEIAGHEASRRRLLGDVAHELRSPLTNIRGWVEAADDGVGLDDAELHRLVLDEARRMERITDDLQLLALAEAGDLVLRREPVDAVPILEGLIDAHRARAVAAGVELVLESPVELTLRTDPGRLRQILDNLIANALRHTPEGCRVTLEAGRSGDVVVMAVADTGEGIGAEDLPRVFERLWRGDQSRARAGGSSGLGLPIARGLAEALGGSLDASSAVGEGSRFTVRLPEG